MRQTSSGAYELGTLSSFSTFFASTPPSQQIVGFLDPSASPEHPGWPLRNVLTYLRTRFLNQGPAQVRILCWRDTEAPVDGKSWRSRFGVVEVPGETGLLSDRPSAVGWEKNPQGKLGPRLADLAPMMDPTRYGNLVSIQRLDISMDLLQTCGPSGGPQSQTHALANSSCIRLGEDCRY